MALLAFVMLFAITAFVAAAGYGCYTLLRSAQVREDAEDKRVWEYLLDSRTL